MKIPNEASLSDEQKVVIFAPLKQNMLITGPPGSGKTIVAIFRYRALDKNNGNAIAVAYNQALKQYAQMDATFHSWILTLWNKHFGRKFPMKAGKENDFHFEKALEEVKKDEKSGARTWAHGLQHFIIDEAQDFSCDVHSLIDKIKDLGNFSMTVLADENQQLDPDNNVTIKDLGEIYLMHDLQKYILRKNYRNTREIAEFAKKFYCGLPTGIPELPDEHGEKPQLIETDDLDDAVDRIYRHVQLYEHEEIGVLVKYKRERKQIFKKLYARLGSSNITVQTYGSAKEERNHGLVFDKPGIVTVLCFKSAKGLEFDTVFLPELQTVQVDGTAGTNTKMDLYVMTSRARTRLFLLLTDPKRQAPIRKLMQSPHLIKHKEA